VGKRGNARCGPKKVLYSAVCRPPAPLKMPDSLPQPATPPALALAALDPLPAAVPGARAYSVLALLALASGAAPLDRTTWVLEVLILAAVYAGIRATAERLTPSPVFLRTMFVYAFVMLIGAHWTYGHAPPGEWLRDAFGLARNPWDRVGHLFQGAVPALLILGLRTARPRPVRFALAFAAGVGTCLLFDLLESGAAACMQDGAAFIQAEGSHDSLFDLAFATLGTLIALGLSLNERTPRPAQKRRTRGA